MIRTMWAFKSFKIYRGNYPTDEAKQSLKKIKGSIKAIKNFFEHNPPQISDYKYFLIKNTNKNLPPCLCNIIAHFAAAEPMVTIAFD